MDAQIVPWPLVEEATSGELRKDARWIFHIGHVGSTLVSRLPAHDSAETSDAAWIAAALEFSRTGTGAGGGAVSPGEPWDAGTGWRVG